MGPIKYLYLYIMDRFGVAPEHIVGFAPYWKQTVEAPERLNDPKYRSEFSHALQKATGIDLNLETNWQRYFQRFGQARFGHPQSLPAFPLTPLPLQLNPLGELGKEALAWMEANPEEGHLSIFQLDLQVLREAAAYLGYSFGQLDLQALVRQALVDYYYSLLSQEHFQKAEHMLQYVDAEIIRNDLEQNYGGIWELQLIEGMEILLPLDRNFRLEPLERYGEELFYRAHDSQRVSDETFELLKQDARTHTPAYADAPNTIFDFAALYHYYLVLLAEQNFHYAALVQTQVSAPALQLIAMLETGRLLRFSEIEEQDFVLPREDLGEMVQESRLQESEFRENIPGYAQTGREMAEYRAWIDERAEILHDALNVLPESEHSYVLQRFSVQDAEFLQRIKGDIERVYHEKHQHEVIEPSFGMKLRWVVEQYVKWLNDIGLPDAAQDVRARIFGDEAEADVETSTEDIASGAEVEVEKVPEAPAEIGGPIFAPDKDYLDQVARERNRGIPPTPEQLPLPLGDMQPKGYESEVPAIEQPSIEAVDFSASQIPAHEALAEEVINKLLGPLSFQAWAFHKQLELQLLRLYLLQPIQLKSPVVIASEDPMFMGDYTYYPQQILHSSQVPALSDAQVMVREGGVLRSMTLAELHELLAAQEAAKALQLQHGEIAGELPLAAVPFGFRLPSVHVNFSFGGFSTFSPTFAIP